MTTTLETTHTKSTNPAPDPTKEETTMTPKKTTPKARKTTAHATNEETTMNATTIATTTNAHTTNEETTMPAKTAIATTTTATPSASSSVGLAALVAELSSALDDAESRLGPEAPAITATQKKRTGKPRKGADKVLTQLAPVVEQYGLNCGSLNTTEMLALHQTAQTLLPLQARLQKVAKRVNDEMFTAQTTSWEMGLQFYSLLARRAKTNGDIADSIAPLVKTFSYRHPGAQKQTKETTRVKAQLKRTMAIAQKHGVSVTVAPDGGVQAITGAPAAVAAAQAELAVQGGAAAAPSGQSAGSAGLGNGAAGAATAAPAAAGVVGGTSGVAAH